MLTLRNGDQTMDRKQLSLTATEMYCLDKNIQGI